MVLRTAINKSNTIVKDDNCNYGLYPISMLNYGNIISRFILKFDVDDIKKMINSYGGDKSNVTCTLKMYNCGNVDINQFGNTIPSGDVNGEKCRATSFTVIAIALPNEYEYKWDEGIGFDGSSDFWLVGRSSVSTEGSNWFNVKSGSEWLKTPSNERNEGVYNKYFIYEEYQRYIECKKNGGDYDGIIIGEQHFDHGNEDLSIDITSYINTTELNNGIMLMFEPETEMSANNMTQYVGFFNEKTNTFFRPCVETRINDAIQDNRFDFALKSDNRLYLYFNDGDKFVDLDTIPFCKINGVDYDVTRQFEGIYYATVEKYRQEGFETDTILNDTWFVQYNGEDEEIEQDFVIHPSKYKFTPQIGDNMIYEPALSGVNDGQNINNGNVVKVNVKFRKPYSTEFKFVNNSYYRIYAKEVNKEIPVIDWDYIENVGCNNYFIIDTTTLSPAEYHVDIKVKNGLQTKIFKDKLWFKIPSETDHKHEI